MNRCALHRPVQYPRAEPTGASNGEHLPVCEESTGLARISRCSLPRHDTGVCRIRTSPGLAELQSPRSAQCIQGHLLQELLREAMDRPRTRTCSECGNIHGLIMHTVDIIRSLNLQKWKEIPTYPCFAALHLALTMAALTAWNKRYAKCYSGTGVSTM
jgi:hypothetical protein